jgi:hypothetical protein
LRSRQSVAERECSWLDSIQQGGENWAERLTSLLRAVRVFATMLLVTGIVLGFFFAVDLLACS